MIVELGDDEVMMHMGCRKKFAESIQLLFNGHRRSMGLPAKKFTPMRAPSMEDYGRSKTVTMDSDFQQQSASKDASDFRRRDTATGMQRSGGSNHVEKNTEAGPMRREL